MSIPDGVGLLFGAFSLLWLAGLAVMIWALVDCLKVPEDSRYQSGTKLVWVLVIVLLQGLGGIIYLAIGRPKPGSTWSGAPEPSAGPRAEDIPSPPPGALG